MSAAAARRALIQINRAASCLSAELTGTHFPDSFG
jgi:hypothetical protein